MNNRHIKKIGAFLTCTLLLTNINILPEKFSIMKVKDNAVFAESLDDSSIISNVETDFQKIDDDLTIKNINWTLLDSISGLINKLDDKNSSKAGLLQKLSIYRIKLSIASLSAGCPLTDYDNIKLQINALQADAPAKQDLLNSLADQSDKRIIDLITPMYSYAYDKMASSNVTSSIIHDAYTTLNNIVSLLSHVVIDENKNNIIDMISPLVTAYNSKGGSYFDVKYELSKITANSASGSNNNINTNSNISTSTNTTNSTTTNTNSIYSLSPMGNSEHSSAFILKDSIFKNGDNMTVTFSVAGEANRDNFYYNSDTGIEILLNEKQYSEILNGSSYFYINVKGSNYDKNYSFIYNKDDSIVPILKPIDIGCLASTKVTKSMNTFDIADLVLDSRSSFDYIVIANKNSIPDCLSGAMLSSRLDAPILMIDDSDIGTLRNYLSKHMSKSGTIFILGGNGAVSNTVENAISVYGNVKRFGGTDRFDTNKKILDAMELKVYSEIIIASGNSFADAVSASTASGKYNIPIILSDVHGLNQEMLNKIKQINPQKVTIVGGTAAVSSDVESQLSAIEIKNINRINGVDREETAMFITNNYFKNSLNSVLLIGKDDYALGMSLAPLTVITDSAVIINMWNNINYAKKAVKANNYIDLTR